MCLPSVTLSFSTIAIFLRSLLNAEDVAQITIIALRPQVMPGDRIDKLGCDPDLITDLPDASLQDISHAQFTAHVLDLDRPVLVRERRISRDHGEATDLREIGDDIVRDAIGEVLLLRVVAHVRERQHDDGGLFSRLEPRRAAADSDPGGASPRVEESTPDTPAPARRCS